MPTPLQQVEQNLSEIAVAQISEKNPNLLNYYLGFDIIDKNDDGTRAAGIMGFKLGGQLIYIPVFFLNGKVKGMEVMYLKNSDTFVANNEQWVNYISGQNPEDLGEPAQQKQITEGETTNTLRIFSRPPASANSKAASLENFYEISVDDFIDTKIAVSEPEGDLVDFLKKAGEETYKDFIKTALENPKLFTYISKFYDLDELKINFESSSKKASEIEKENKNDVKVRLIKSEELMNKNASDLSNEEKSNIIKRGYKLEDSREDSEKSDLYLGDYRQEFSQVTETGIYDILNHNGELVNALVFVGPRSIENGHTPQKSTYHDCCVPQIVIDPKNGNFQWASEQVYYRSGTDIIENLDENDKNKILEKTGKDLKSCAIGKKYFLVDHKLSLYGPFSVTNKITENSKTTILAEQDYIPGTSCSCWGQKIYLRATEKEHGLPEFTKGNVVFVPKCCKVIEIKEKDLKDCGDCPVPVDSSGNAKKEEIKDIKPGNFRTLQTLLTSRDAKPVRVVKSAAFDFNVLFDNEAIGFRERSEVVLDLMSRVGLTEDGAEKIATEIFENKKTDVYGWTLPNKQKLAYPSVETPTGAAGSNRDGTPIQTQQMLRTEMMPASTGPRPATDMDFGIWNQITDDDLDFLERASDSNSRQVFDPAMIGVIVRTSRSQSIVQDYIPELVDNLDRMCRLLLLFYWHNSDFAEEYGIDEMADFEDLILSTIKSTAKVVLFLKQRAVESAVGQTDVLE